MAREYARIRLAIWEDGQFRALDADAQHLYLLLLTSPKLDYCGVTDWRERRIAQLVGDWTAERVAAAGRQLAERLYLVIDEDSEEVLIRSFIRNDRLLDSPNMAKAIAKAYAGIASAALRGVVVHELRRLRVQRLELKDSWAHLATVLDRDFLDPRDHLEAQGITPFEKGSAIPSRSPSDTPSESGSMSPSDTPSRSPSESASDTLTTKGSTGPSATPVPNPDPATAPPSTTSSGEGRRKRRTHLPEDWTPSSADVAWQRSEGISDEIARRELPIFVDHWRSNGEPKADWPATWKNWLRRTMRREPVIASGAGARPPGWEFGQ